MLLLAVLSPVRDAPGTASSAFLTVLSSLDGDLSLVIWKSRYAATLYKGQTPVKTYRAVFGRGYADGDKERAGDRRTPEGEFYICSRNHSSRFYKFLGLSYPGLRHAGQGLRKGMITPGSMPASPRRSWRAASRAGTRSSAAPWGSTAG
jgi:hypothetical protein